MNKDSQLIFNNQSAESQPHGSQHTIAPSLHYPPPQQYVFNQGKHLELLEATKAQDLAKAAEILNSVSNPEQLLNLVDSGQFHQSIMYKVVLLPDESMALQFCQLFVSKGARILFKDAYNQSPMFYLCKEGRVSLFNFFLDHGADINETDQFRQTPLFYAARDGKSAMVRVMLERKANPNHKDKAEQSPLFYAARDNRLETCKVLIEMGADVNIVDSKKQTALFYAKKQGNKEVEEFLIASGAINTKDGIVRPSDIRRPPKLRKLISANDHDCGGVGNESTEGAEAGGWREEEAEADGAVGTEERVSLAVHRRAAELDRLGRTGAGGVQAKVPANRETVGPAGTADFQHDDFHKSEAGELAVGCPTAAFRHVESERRSDLLPACGLAKAGDSGLPGNRQETDGLRHCEG